MRGMTLLDSDLHRGQRNSDFSISNDVEWRVRYRLLSDSDTSAKYFCQQVACITCPQEEVWGAELREVGRKGNVECEGGSGVDALFLDRTVDF